VVHKIYVSQFCFVSVLVLLCVEVNSCFVTVANDLLVYLELNLSSY